MCVAAELYYGCALFPTISRLFLHFNSLSPISQNCEIDICRNSPDPIDVMEGALQ